MGPLVSIKSLRTQGVRYHAIVCIILILNSRKRRQLLHFLHQANTPILFALVSSVLEKGNAALSTKTKVNASMAFLEIQENDKGNIVKTEYRMRSEKTGHERVMHESTRFITHQNIGN